MIDRPPKEPQLRQELESDSDSSGSFEVSQELQDIAPLAPLLQKSVEHMKRGNQYQKEGNKETARLNKLVNRLVTFVVIGAVIGVLLLLGLIYSLYEQRGLRTMLEANALTQADNVRKMNDVISKLDDAKKVAEDTKKAVEEQPTITVKPADTTDPTSKPVLVVQPKPKPTATTPVGDAAGPPRPPAKLKGVEIPIDKNLIDTPKEKKKK